jgi:hypothetical protein
METELTSESVASAVAAWATRSAAGLDIAHAVEHAAEGGSVRVELFTFTDMAAIRTEGLAQSGAIVRPSYVLTVTARDGES